MFELETHYVESEAFEFLYEASINGKRIPGRYITKQMAIANALCWMEFHMRDENENSALDYDISVGDTVETQERSGGIPRRVWTGPEFLNWLSGAMQKFPEMKFQVGTEMDGRKTRGNDFFLGIKVTPEKKSWRVFIVRKDSE